MRKLMALAILALVGTLASAQPANPNQQNDLILHNGVDGIFFLSTPSVGAPTGTNPPMITGGDWFWKVFPKEVLQMGVGVNGGPGTMEISGFQFQYYDSNWTTNSNFYDIIMTPGMPSVANVGNIEPNFASPNGVFISLGVSMLPDPCTVNPALCMGGCPVGGGVNGWNLDVQLGTGTGNGIVITADGTADYTVACFAPGGMVITGGPCGGGDYSFMLAASSNAFVGGIPEAQPDWLGTGYSAYGGVSLGGGMVTGIFPDPVTDSTNFTLQFVERTLTPLIVTAPMAAVDRGLVGLHYPTTSGATSIGFESFSYQGVVSGTPSTFTVVGTASTLPPPGIGGLLLDINDPLFLFTFGLGFTGGYTYVPGGMAASGFHNGQGQTGLFLPLVAGIGPVNVTFQAAEFTPTGGLGGLTNAYTVQILP